MADLVKTKKLMEMNEWMIGRKYESIFKMSTESFLMVLGIGEQNERLCQAMEREGEKERERKRGREWMSRECQKIHSASLNVTMREIFRMFDQRESQIRSEY